MIPIWAVALRKIKKTVNRKLIPMLSICAAFSFLIMMFNIPIGASSAHAVGAVFIAILLGPWAACIAVSVALTIQAFVFGDGGVLALAMNCFNMGVVMPFSGYYLYKLIAGKSGLGSKRNLVGVFFGSYVGLNLAALFTSVEFGIQPLLFKAADGTPLYGFYPLWVSIPGMAFAHGLFAGPIEGIITMGAIAYIAKLAPHLLNRESEAKLQYQVPLLKRYRAMIIALAVMAVMTPIGLIATGTAWGEWGSDEIKQQIGYIPKGFAKLSELWKSILPDYAVPALGNSFFSSAIGYIISAVVGVLLICGFILLTSKVMAKIQKGKEESHNR